MGIQINGSTDRITAIDGTIDFVSNIGNIGLITASNYVLQDAITIGAGSTIIKTVNGKLGIGTATPNSAIQINHASPKIILEDNDNGADVSIHNVGGAAVISSASAITFQTSDTSEKFRIDSNGKIGIGTDDPASLLHVSKLDGAAEIMCSSSTQPRLMLKTSGTTAECRVDFGDSGDSSRGAIGYNHSDDALKFYTTGVANERLRITNTGEIRIGGAGADGGYKLNVVDESNRTTTAETALLLYAKHDGSGTTGAGFGTGIRFWGDRASGNVEQNMGRIMCTAEVNSGTTLSGALSFETSVAGSLAERLRIDSSGRLLLGAGAVATPKCDVGGLDVSSGKLSIIMGGEANTGDGTPRANSAQKEARLAMPHYTNAEEPIGLVYGVALSGENRLHLGGGSSIVNAATSIEFWTGGNTTSTTGTLRMKIDTNGYTTIHEQLNVHNYIRTNAKQASGGHMYFKNNSQGANYSSHFQTYASSNEGGTTQTHMHYYHGGYAELLHQGNSSVRTLSNGTQFRNGGNVNGQITPNGLCFGSDTAADNALDDYEEGSFTPTYAGTHSNMSGNQRHARYTRIGNLVFISMEYYISGNNGSWSNGWEIRGFPYNSSLSELYCPPSIGVMYGPGGYNMDDNAAGRCYHLGSNNRLYFKFGTSGVRHLWIQFFHRVEN